MAYAGLDYVDKLFYSYYEKLSSESDDPDWVEIGMDIVQWAGVTATAILSWQAGQTNDGMSEEENKKRTKDKNDQLARVGLATSAAVALAPIIKKIRDKTAKTAKPSMPTKILSYEKKRRDISDCIMKALHKALSEYSTSDLISDLDAYHRAGSPDASSLTSVSSLNC